MGPREDRGSTGQCLAVSGHQLRLSRVRPDVPRASSCVTPWGQLHRGQDQVRRAGVSAGGRGDSGPGRGGPPHQTQAGGRKPDTGLASGGSQRRRICAHFRPRKAASPSLCLLALAFASGLTFHSTIVFCKLSLSETNYTLSNKVDQIKAKYISTFCHCGYFS